MVKVLDAAKPGFEAKLKELLEVDNTSSDEIRASVSSIIKNIKEHGDKALLEYTNKLDKANYKDDQLRVTQDEIEEAYESCSLEIKDALRTAAKRIEAYHYRQMPEDDLFQDNTGMSLGWKWTAIDAVGIYVPGGTASYPSSVLMNAIPARISGVPRVVMVSPTINKKLNQTVLAAAKIAGVEEIYKIGGAQAVASLAYGTETIPPVDKIVGPGNAYVAEAKRQVFGKVGIDMIAGPSEVLIISDSNSNPSWIAADLLSQAEHDEKARCILITDDRDFSQRVLEEVEKQLRKIERETIARAAWKDHALIINTTDLYQAAEIANIIAPEHLELAVNSAKALEKRIRNAGAIFIGRYAPEALGDYIAGPSHVLPTAGSARFSSGLSVFDFLKRTSIMSGDKQSLELLAEETERLAMEEGLDAHAYSIKIRRKN